jgi:aryl-alcohol dehydrogenase-like predicted oxidoreductase
MPAIDPTTTAVGTWSGGRFMRFGEPLDNERYLRLIAPDESIPTVITADVYGSGEADAMLGKAIQGMPRDRMCVVGAVGHDFYTGQRDGAKGFPRFTDPRLRAPAEYGDYLRMATERSLARCGIDSFDLLLLHNPDRIGYTSETVWNEMARLRDTGLTRMIGVAPGPANGFTLDIIDCLERFGAMIDWAMIILNPLEPWPGELCLGAAAANQVKVITRVVDYGGLFFDDVRPGQEMLPQDHRGFRPAGWIEAGRGRLDAMRPIAERAGLTLLQVVALVSRRVEEKRAELGALPAEIRLTDEEVDQIRALGDNTGCMTLKGASPVHTGDERADGWGLDENLQTVARRWRIEPDRDLVQVGGAA